jgi:hypothetical protein
VLRNPHIDEELPARIVRPLEKAIEFAKEYISILREIGIPGKRLDLTKCVQNLVNASGDPLLKDGPTDPLLEFLAILRSFTIGDRAFFFSLVVSPDNQFLKLFSFMTSSGFSKPKQNSFMQPSSGSSIFNLKMEGFFHDFTREDNRPNAVVLHSLPDIICMHFEEKMEYKEKEIQMVLDFTNYVFDNSKKWIYEINSFIMMISNVHAVAYVRRMDSALGTDAEEWLICNDLQQDLFSLKDLKNDMQSCGSQKRAIMAFYERRK